jgi:hypothetical protein
MAVAEQLGRIEKPEAERFRKGKKLYVVPLIYSGEDAPGEYKERCDHYWQQVTDQLTNLASKIGKVNRVYHESIFQRGKEGVGAIERLNAGSYRIAKTQCDDGAVLEVIEERELFEEVMDWQRCLMLGLISDNVEGKVSELYVEAAKKRNKLIARNIRETLKDDEAGLLFIGESHSVQFPGDMEVFTIFPPALDDIHRWLRDQARLRAGKVGDESKGESEADAREVENKTGKGAEVEP